MFIEISEEEFAAAFDGCAAEALWEAGITGPPIDALVVAEGLRFIVTRDRSMQYRGRFARLTDRYGSQTGQGAIVVGPVDRPEREQWTVAHEIGESIAYRVFDRLGVESDDVVPSAREAVANRLASSLLLPRRWFFADGCNTSWNLLALKERYFTASHELIARRMLEMQPPIVISMFDHGRLRWRRSNGTSRPPDLLREERNAWQLVHGIGMPVCKSLHSESGLQRITCWPIHEPGWKREIMRSEILEV